MTAFAGLNALASLTKKEMSEANFEKFFQETRAESNHRSAAILLVINVELILDKTILQYLQYERCAKLFRQDCPLGSLSNKILLAYALNIFGDEMFNNLEIMRHIRNAFAHAHIPIDFTTKEVNDAVSAMTVPKLQPPHTVGADKEDTTNLSGFERFRLICEYVGHNLFVRLWHRPIKLKSEFIDRRFVEAYPHYEVTGRPPPSP